MSGVITVPARASSRVMALTILRQSFAISRSSDLTPASRV